MDAPAQLLPARAARTRRRIRPLRTLLFIIAIIIVLGGIIIVIMRGSYTQPLSLVAYQNATLVGTHVQQPGIDRTVYYSPDDWNHVAGFYVQQLGVAVSDGSGCKGVGDREVAHCLIDHVTLGYEQTERITISTIINPKDANKVEIDIDRNWPTN